MAKTIQRKKRKKSNKGLYIILAVVVVLIAAIVMIKGGKDKEITVDLDTAKKSTIIETVSASGMIQPVIEVKLSPDVAGEIIQLNVAEGDSVGAGQLLVKIRPDNWINALERARASLNQQKANLASSKAGLKRAEANFERLENDYNRQKKLHDQGVISEADFQMAEQNFKVGQNDLESARQNVIAANHIVSSSAATVSEANENVRLTSVFSPTGGIVSKLSVEKGERVVGTNQMAGTEMLRIADLNKMEVRVNVNENDIIRVGVGDTAEIDVDSYAHLDKKFKGVVTAIANTANDKASADAITEFEVKVKILNSSYSDLMAKGNKYPFRPGMTASVDIVTERKDEILSVPLAAVTTRTKSQIEAKPGEGRAKGNFKGEGAGKDKKKKEEPKEVVFILEDGKTQAVEVKTGISDYDNIEILSGLKDGQKIVVGPFLAISKRLKNGDAVKSSKPEDNEKPEDTGEETEAEEAEDSDEESED